MLGLWLTLVGLFLGSLVLWTEALALIPVLLLVAAAAVGGIVARAYRTWADPFNPLLAVVAFSIVRFTLPAFAMSPETAPRDSVLTFLRLDGFDWQSGHALAVTGVLGVFLGWVLVADRSERTKPLVARISDGVFPVALAGMIVGLGFLLLFVQSNAPVREVIERGTFRATRIRVGTGPYFFLALLLISASVTAAAALMTRTRGSLGRALALWPTLIAMIGFGILGGRMRAAAALVAGLLLLWYFGRQRARAPSRPARPVFTWVLLGVILGLSIAYVGSVYRGSGGGLAGVRESLTVEGVREYITEGILVDAGHLHSLAAATSVGPARLGGQTLLYNLTWPLGELVPIPGRSAGIFIFEETSGLRELDWGLHATLIGDAYVNLGIAGVIVVCVLFGAGLKHAYRAFRAGSMHVVLYVLLAVYAMRIFFESIEKWPEMLVVVGSARLMLLAGSALRLREPQPARTAAAPIGALTGGRR